MLTEHQEQSLFVEWFELQFPAIKFFAVPNGEKRHISVAKRLKKEGVRSGVPDLYFPAWRLWIEFKREKGGTLSPAQKEWRDYLIGIGDTHIVAKGFVDAKIQIAQFLDSL